MNPACLDFDRHICTSQFAQGSLICSEILRELAYKAQATAASPALWGIYHCLNAAIIFFEGSKVREHIRSFKPCRRVKRGA